MKKHFLISTVLFSGVFYAQSNCDNVKLENTNLKSEIQSVKTENDYLKKVLEINTSILSTEKNNDIFKITKVIGNKSEKRIYITFLTESKDENKKMIFQDISIIDLEGNEYNIDLYKSSNPYPDLSTNVPMKNTFSFKDILDEPKIIKLLRFKVTTEPMKNTFDKKKAELEFRDLKVIWN